jgi:template-activating factor I
MSGKKRASPGADVEKDPFDGVELSTEAAQALDEIDNAQSKIDLLLERESHKRSAPLLTKRRAVLKGVDRFWPLALMQTPGFAIHAQHPKDIQALTYLEDFWVERDATESRVFTLEFHFKSNPYFEESVLKKVFKYNAPPTVANDIPDEDGITKAMLEFSWERDVEALPTKITWKDDAHNLVKLYPAVKDEDGDMADSGSFFNWLTSSTDDYDLGLLLANELFPDAVQYFLGKVTGDDSDEDSLDSDADDSDADEIDLEKPQPKKQKKA